MWISLWVTFKEGNSLNISLILVLHVGYMPTSSQVWVVGGSVNATRSIF